MRRGTSALGTAAAVRGAALVLVVAVSLAELLAFPEPAGLVVAGVAVLTGAVVAVAPVTALEPAVLVLLVGEHLLATHHASAVARGAGALALGTALWLLHGLYALAALVPPDAEVDPAVPRRWLRRQVEVLAVALPLGLLALLVGAVVGGDVRGLPVVGLLAAAALLVVPGVLARRTGPARR